MNYSKFDFEHSEKVSKDELRTLSALHEDCCRFLETGLANYLRTLAVITLDGVEQMTYSQFLTRMQNPTFIAVVGMKPLEGHMVLEMDLNLLYAFVDRLLGGNGNPAAQNREPTEIEQGIIERIIVKIMDAIQETWAHFIKLELKIDSKETNPQFVQVLSLNELVIQIKFTFKIGDVSGAIRLAMPVLALKPVMAKFTMHEWIAGKANRTEDAGTQHPDLKTNVCSAKLPVVAEMGSATISLKDLLHMREGDVMRFRFDEDIPVRVMVKDKIKFMGRVGIMGNKKAVKISQVKAR